MGLSGTAITETTVFTATVPKPASGTMVRAEDVEAGDQVNANRTQWIREHAVFDTDDSPTGATRGNQRPVRLGSTLRTAGNITGDQSITATAGNIVATAGSVQAGASVSAVTSVSAGTNVEAGQSYEFRHFAAKSVTYTIEGIPWIELGWSVDGNGDFQTANALAGQRMRIPLHLPHGATLTSIQLRVAGAGGGRASLPNVKTRATVKAKDLNIPTAISTVIATVEDPSASVLSYEQEHVITLTASGSGVAIDRVNKRYYVEMTSEDDSGGGVAVAGYTYLGGTVTYSYQNVRIG